ncbi:hypothetical protein BEN49_00520 [Hymenobacter coccineus]|uniref:Uncharacterized protein n=1 Tax=Hymenobacter coccineus TaxID=1908235 RepID=A0A1G1TIV8_9BACT|nr:hypothetical protein BEN49_00520 [Hymenobacter coccineus]
MVQNYANFMPSDYPTALIFYFVTNEIFTGSLNRANQLIPTGFTPRFKAQSFLGYRDWLRHQGP